ncbi:MAG: hypothetical protein HY560_03070 [Gemmatimonadetes bacterium]|nr:hypothetical protein [Gemmatimonadota bacterium]
MNLPRYAPPLRPWARIGTLLAGVLVLTGARPTSARTGEPDHQTQSPPPSGVRIYVGMWTAHFRHLGRGLGQNWLVGVVWRGYYGGTFVNSYGDRAFAAGIQRTLARGKDGVVVPSLGYRIGVVSGYDKRFISVASRTPVLPLVQLLGAVERGRTEAELAWAGLVASLSPNFRF